MRSFATNIPSNISADTIKKEYFISVVAVIRNDSDIITNFVYDTISVLKKNYENYELLIIDNDSKDNTSKIMDSILEKEECIRYIKLSKRHELEVAFSAGLDIVIGDVIITLEPQCDPSRLIPVFVEKTIKKGGVVYGIRANYDKHMPFYYKFGKNLFHIFCQMFFDFSTPKDAGFFMGMSRSALNAIVQIKSRSKFLRVFGKRIGYNVDSIKYNIVLRRKTLKKRNFTKSVDYALAVIFTNSNKPLRMISVIGLFAALINLVYIVLILMMAGIRKSFVDAFTLSSLQNSVMFFFIFLVIAFFIEYFVRNVESKKEEGPLYYIEFEKTSSVMIRNEENKRNIYENPRME